jgi:hypothetical protein
MPTSVSRLLHDNYTAISRDLVAPLVGLLALARQVCHGDLDKLLIVLLIALRSAEHRDVPDLDIEDILAGRVAVPSLHTNVRSIADSTGIPRETVRRKVAELVAFGWVARDGDDLSYTAEGARALTPVREALLDRASRLHAAVAALLRREEAQNGPSADLKTAVTA